MKKEIRVIVIDDSAFMRKVISDILMSDRRIKVVATARNGKDGLKKINALNPDVVTLDVEMPVMDGITTLHHIMTTHPLPVVMLSSTTTESATKTVQAVSMGAIDFIAKTSEPISLDIRNIKEEIISKVMTAANAKVSVPTKKKTEKNEQVWLPQSARTVIAIGTSTGGPKALEQILSSLPKNFPSPILIVQHMPASFTKSLADRLNDHASLDVKEANHGEIVQPATAYIAPGNKHMTIQQEGTTEVIKLTNDAHKNGHRPSVDVLFNSVATLNDVNKIAVILTGMGKDGAASIKHLKRNDQNAIVLAESSDTAVINGMPIAAIKTQCVDKVLSLHQMSDILTNLVQQSRGLY